MGVLPTNGEDWRADRRQWDRYSPDGQTSVTLAAGGRTYDCELVDLSLGGARLRVDEDLPDESSVVLLHRVGGIFFASTTWRRGNEIGIRFGVPAQTREHALQCAAVLLHGDQDAVLARPEADCAEGVPAAG